MLLRYLTWGAVSVLSIVVSGCANIDYVYTDTLVKKGIISQESREDGEDKKSMIFYIPKYLGAIKVKDNSEPNGDRLFLIKREKSALMAETQVYEGTYKYFDRIYMSVGASPQDYVGLQFRFEDDDNKYFEKAYLHIGANKKKNRVGIELRFVY